MSTSESGRQKVRLIAEAEEGTEIFVIDGAFRRVAAGLKHMEAELPAGLYTVKFKRGNALGQVDADLLPGAGPVRVQSPGAAMDFASPAPMSQTDTSHEYHQAAAAHLSRTEPVAVGHGQGGRLFVFVRDVGLDGLGNPAGGLTLHDPRGRTVVDFARLGETGSARDTSAAAWYGGHVDLAPGFYRLRAPRPGLPGLEQAIILVENWQVQVFALRRPSPSSVAAALMGKPGGSAGTIDLSNDTLFMARPGCGFDPHDPSVRLTELARQGLSSGRIPVTEADLRQMLADKFENPMLGLFAAHLLAPLLAGEAAADLRGFSDPGILKANRALQQVLGIAVDGIVGPQTRRKLRDLLEVVAGNLAAMLGEHPDVQAIRRELSGSQDQKGGAENGAVPPMLQRSWDTLVRSDPRYALAKAGSILERIADRTWGGGPWFIWQVPPAAPRKAGIGRERFRRLLSRIGRSDARTLEDLLQRAGVNPAEESIVRYSLMGAGAAAFRKAAPSTRPPAAQTPSFEKDHRETARLLGLPVVTLKRSLASVLAKIDAAGR